MRRETSSEHIESLITRIRAGIPGIAIRTTFIVGFPGETEEEFEYLMDFIKRTRFELRALRKQLAARPEHADPNGDAAPR